MKKSLAYILILLHILWTVESFAAGTCGSADDGAGTTNCTGTAPWTSDSASREDVNHCVNTCASSGDTVTVANGDATWDTQILIEKGIKLVGGTGTITFTGTTTNAYGIKWQPSDPSLDEAFEFSGFTLTGAYILHLSNTSTYAYPLTKIKIHNSTWNQTSDGYALMTSGGPIWGVVYSNTFDGAGGEVINLVGGGDADAWNNLTHEYGTVRAFFMEDNTFQNCVDRPIDSGRGQRYVARYNTIGWVGTDTESAFDMHGDQVNGCGGMVMEDYGNLIQAHAKDDFLVSHRGSWALGFYNLKEGTDDLYLKLYNDDGNNSGTCSHPSNPIKNDISNSYYWGNYNGDGDLPIVSSVVGSEPTENTDYWVQLPSFDGTAGTGCGTLAARPATCTTGVGYWATDQSCSDLTGLVGVDPATPISGTLYKCTATDTWEAYYTPYSYPHPLRGETTTHTITSSKVGAVGTLSYEGESIVNNGGNSQIYTAANIPNGWKVTWSGTGGCTGNGTTCQVPNVTGDVTVIATFSEIKLMPW